MTEKPSLEEFLRAIDRIKDSITPIQPKNGYFLIKKRDNSQCDECGKESDILTYVGEGYGYEELGLSICDVCLSGERWKYWRQKYRNDGNV